MMNLVSRLARPLPLLAVMGLMLGAAAPTLHAQADSTSELMRLNRRLNRVIQSSSIDDIKWKNITIYQLGEDYKNRLLQIFAKEDEKDNAEIDAICEIVYDEPLQNCRDRIMQIVRSPQGHSYALFKKKFAQVYNVDEEDFDDAELNRGYQLALALDARQQARPKDFFLVTSTKSTGEPILIAMLGVSDVESNPTVKGTPWVGMDLYNFLTNNSSNQGMYQELKTSVADNSAGSDDLINKMFVLRNLDEITIAERTKLQATYLPADQYAFLLTFISEGHPVRGKPQDSSAPATVSLFGPSSSSGGGLFGSSNATGVKRVLEGAEVPGTGQYAYEASLGSDILASLVSYDIDENNVPTVNWGIELKNNFDEINYPSIWGGRMSLSAILNNVRIGAVLPELRFGGQTIGESGIGGRPQNILGGYGALVAGNVELPFFGNAGLFNFYASYTFAEQSTQNMAIHAFDTNDMGYYESAGTGDMAYLIRYALQGYYSFGFSIDPESKHLFRLKFGGTVYEADEYERRTDTTAPSAATGGIGTIPGLETTSASTVMQKLGTETIGGVSGRIEYMRGGSSIPYGAALQYFDGALLAEAWLQFIVSQKFDIKFGGKYFTPVFRDPHAWEGTNLVVPTISVKYHFGR